MRRLLPWAVILTAAAALTGCAGAPSSPPPAPSADGGYQVDAGDAVGDAVYGPTWQVAFAQVAASYDTMLVQSESLCLTSNIGGAVDPTGFHAAQTEYDQAQAALTADGREAPAGYPATAPVVDESDWCAANGVLKSAR